LQRTQTTEERCAYDAYTRESTDEDEPRVHRGEEEILINYAMTLDSR
jgi:hypothetical protein